MMRVVAITLDLDDTLWPIEPVIARAERRLDAWLKIHCPRAAAAYPIPAMRALREQIAAENPHLAHDFTAQRCLSLQQALLPHGYGQAQVDAAFAEYYAARNQVDCFVDALPALTRLAARYPLVSVSNGNADLHRIGLAGYFRFSVSARDCGVAKPSPSIFHAACARLGVAPADVLHVGDDAELDIVGAQAAGLQTAWINRAGAAWTHAQRPHLDVRDLAELADVLAAHATSPIDTGALA
jgi:putative hydrolase of the HAD superfamily